MPYANIEDKRKQQRILRAKRKDAFFAGKFCVDCGSVIKLELHHLDPSTKKDSWIWLWGEQKRNEEISKCIVLCRSCHFKRHYNMKKEISLKELKHGTPYLYKKGCRCNLCRYNETKRVMKYHHTIKGNLSS